jgi:tetratricopeptide (TPR) repeat protein
VKANEVLERALAVRESAPVRNEARIAEMRINLARKQEKLGEFAKADLTYQKAEAQVRGSVGENHQTYWAARAYHARMLHMRGERLRADAILEETVGKMPPGGKASMTPVLVRELYAECLVAEGRASVAVPLLETAESVYRERTQNDYDVREVRRKLGDAYDRVGRTAEARERLKASRDEYLAKEPGSTWTLRIRERWGRFLLEHAVVGEPSFAAGEAELRAVADEVESRPLVEGALAHGGLSRAARARGDVAGALEQSRLALAAFERARGLYDLRVGPYVWLARSSALAAGGDSRAARTFAEKALAASTLYDVPASAAIGDARAAVSAFR